MGEVVDFWTLRDMYELVSGKDWDTGSGMDNNKIGAGAHTSK